MISTEATSTRLDDSDHKNHDMEAARSGGRDITRRISSERVSRMLNCEGRIVAMYAPLGLGMDWVDAKLHSSVSQLIEYPGRYSYTSMIEKTAS